jgi:hypothetical protein
MGLMKIETTGRQITKRGKDYLKAIDPPELEGLGMVHLTEKVKKTKSKIVDKK